MKLHVKERFSSHYFSAFILSRYDIYATDEPDVYESMALVHSRIRRVIFKNGNTESGGLGGTGKSNAVHCLPGTNHHYRVFSMN